MVVEVRDQVHAAVLALQHEGEQVGLPQLVRPRALESLRLLPMGARHRRRRRVARFDQHPGDRRSTGLEALGPHQDHRDPVLAPVRVLLLQHQDRPLGRLGKAAPGRPAEWLVIEPRRPEFGEPRLPGAQRVQRQPDQRREVAGRQLAPQPSVQDQQPLLG